MAKVLLVWECGGGLGHLVRYQSLIQSLLEQGHEPIFCVRNLQSAAKIFNDAKVALLPAPIVSNEARRIARVQQPASFLDVLINQCFDSQEGLRSRIRAWIGIFTLVEPELIIFDHSPTALMAAQIFSDAQCLISGTGFTIPPLEKNIVPFRPSSTFSAQGLHEKNQKLLSEILNPVLASLGGPQLNSCLDIFNHPLQIFGIEALDHYAQVNRPELFIGEQAVDSVGKKAVWPKGQGPKVFIYSEQHPHLASLLRLLSELNWPVVAVAKPSARKVMMRFHSDTIFYSDELVDIQTVAQECDFAITNANMATCLQFVKNGKAMLLLPAHIEQKMFAERLVETDCGLNLNDVKTEEALKAALLQLGDSDCALHQGVKVFAEKIEPSLRKDADKTFSEAVFSRLS